MRRMHDDKEVVSKVGFDSTTNKLTVEQANGDKKTYTIAGGGGSGVDPESLLANMEGSDYIELGIDESEDKVQVEVTNIETAGAEENSTKLITSGAVFADLADKADVEDIPTKVSDLTNDSNFSAVSGTNDGTNWTSITIDGTTKSIPQGGGGASYTAGDGIDITNNEISVDSTVAKVADIPTAVSDLTNDENFSSVSGTNDGTNWQSITIDGTTKNIPAPTSITAGDGINISNGQISVDNTVARVSDITQLTFSEDKVQGGDDLGSITVGNDSWNIPDIPTKTSDLTNDSGFITSSALSSYRTSSAQDVIDATKADISSLAAVATSGDYDDLSDKPDLSIYAESANLATVATSGSYNDLTNKPTLATVATTGDYDDLTDKPTLGTLAAKNNVNYETEVTNKPTLGTLAAKNSVDYTTEVTNKPTLGALASKDSVNYSTEVTNKPDLSVYALSASLATVATSGDYDDLSNKPTIPSELTAGTGISIANDEVSTNAREIVEQDAFDTLVEYTHIDEQGVDYVTVESGFFLESMNNNGTVFLEYFGEDSLGETVTINKEFEFTQAMYDTIENDGTVTINSEEEGAGTFTIQKATVEGTHYRIDANPTARVATDVSFLCVITGYTVESISNKILNNEANINSLADAVTNKLDATMCTYQTTAPTEAIDDGGVHIVFLSAEPATKYNGYIYLIAEA